MNGQLSKPAPVCWWGRSFLRTQTGSPGSLTGRESFSFTPTLLAYPRTQLGQRRPERCPLGWPALDQPAGWSLLLRLGGPGGHLSSAPSRLQTTFRVDARKTPGPAGSCGQQLPLLPAYVWLTRCQLQMVTRDPSDNSRWQVRRSRLFSAAWRAEGAGVLVRREQRADMGENGHGAGRP